MTVCSQPLPTRVSALFFVVLENLTLGTWCVDQPTEANLLAPFMFLSPG